MLWTLLLLLWAHTIVCYIQTGRISLLQTNRWVETSIKASRSKFIESLQNRGLDGQKVVLVVDADNVRGKSGFKLSKEDLLCACEKIVKSVSFLSVLVVIDHGSQEEAFMLRIEGEDLKDSADTGLKRGVGVVFAGPGKSADDVIARDVLTFQSLQYRGVLEEGTVIGVVTHDMELRKRCRPKPVRMTKKERKKESKKVAEDQGTPLDVRIVSSKLFAEYAEELVLSDNDEEENETAFVTQDKEKDNNSVLAVAARKKLLTQEIALRAKLKESESLLSSCINRKVKPRLEAEVTSLRERVAALEQESPLLLEELQALSVYQMRERLAMGRVNPKVEETWERALLAERLRQTLSSREEKSGDGENEEWGAADLAIDAYVRHVNSNRPECIEGLAAVPSEIEGYQVEPVAVDVCGRRLYPLVLAQEEAREGQWDSLGDPCHPRNRAMQDMRDSHGVMGVWPSAIAAVRALDRIKRGEGQWLRMVELGAGAGLPTLHACLSGIFGEVLSTDMEPLPLAFVHASYGVHSGMGERVCRFSTLVVDVTEPGDVQGLLDDVDCVVAADLLYVEEVASAVGQLLGKWVRHRAGIEAVCHLVVVDPGRQGRDAFLKEFREISGKKEACFEDVEVDGVNDVFDGSSVSSVGVLKCD